MARRTAKQALMVVGLATILSVLLQQTVLANQVLQNIQDPMQVIIQTPLDGNTAHTGDLFEAVLAEDVTFQNQLIPAETVFYGYVSDHRLSRRFNRPGYIALAVQRVVFPNGTEVFFSEDERVGSPLLNPEVMAKRKQNSYYNKIKLPLLAVGFVVAPPVALATRGAVGVVAGASDDAMKDASIMKKAGYGLYQMTPLPMVVDLSKKAPNPQFNPGDPIALGLPPEAMLALLRESMMMGYHVDQPIPSLPQPLQ